MVLMHSKPPVALLPSQALPTLFAWSLALSLRRTVDNVHIVSLLTVLTILPTVQDDAGGGGAAASATSSKPTATKRPRVDPSASLDPSTLPPERRSPWVTNSTNEAMANIGTAPPGTKIARFDFDQCLVKESGFAGQIGATPKIVSTIPKLNLGASRQRIQGGHIYQRDDCPAQEPGRRKAEAGGQDGQVRVVCQGLWLSHPNLCRDRCHTAAVTLVLPLQPNKLCGAWNAI
eukprot:m.64950 g.64950  ORF g.64950 m.64950 type:complete len:232 (-) comp9734_c0_seq3:1397-2092(-)